MGKKDSKKTKATEAPKAAVKTRAAAPVAKVKPAAKPDTAVTEAPPVVDEFHGGDTVATPEQGDPAFVIFNRLLDMATIKAAIPAVQEKCSCGASIAVSEVVPEADRKRHHNAWLRKHKECGAA